MVSKTLATGVAGAIGSHYLPIKNQIVFVEYGGFISKIDLSRSLHSIVSQGTTTIKGTFGLDCETGNIVNSPAGTRDIWWEQVDSTVRNMVPQNGAKAVNLGVVDFNSVTPASLQTYDYTTAKINGSNNASNKLVAGDVFCVKTALGNYCKVQVVTYGYDLVVKWMTVKLNPAYARIGSGYSELEDIVVASDENTAYVTERGGNVLKLNLTAANRASATVVSTGFTAPHQLHLDQLNNTLYLVEYANPGKLYRVNIAGGAKTVVASGLKNAVGLAMSSDQRYAYISEQGLNAITRYDLLTASKITIATGLTNPFMLSWADPEQTRLIVPERDPANRVSIVDVTRTSANVSVAIPASVVRPSSVAVVSPGAFAVFGDSVVELYFLAAVPGVGSYYKGIGYVPFNLITGTGFADTTMIPAYWAQFPKNSPFGGTLPVQIDHRRAWDGGAAFYKVLIGSTPRMDSWNELVMNPANGRYEIVEPQVPDASGFYKVHNPSKVYYNSDLGCLLDSTNLPHGTHTLTVQFFNAAKVQIGSATGTNVLRINNQSCKAVLDLPTLDGNRADPNCGYLKYSLTSSAVKINWAASHPEGYYTWAFGIIKGANHYYSEPQPSPWPTPMPHVTSKTFSQTVATMLGTCPGVAAFADSLGVYATMINGIGRQSQYDAYAGMAFCLAK